MSADVDAAVEAPDGSGRAQTTTRFYGSPGDQSRDAASRRSPRIATVSHTLEAGLADRLRSFAFHERMSESAVIEFALLTFFGSGDDAELGQRLRDAGATRRRRV